MIRFDEKSSNLSATDLGRVASHFYVNHDTISNFNDLLKPKLNDAGMFYHEKTCVNRILDILAMISEANEFENIMLREEEMGELSSLQEERCPIPVKGGPENKHGKVNILLQSYLSMAQVHNPLTIF